MNMLDTIAPPRPTRSQTRRLGRAAASEAPLAAEPPLRRPLAGTETVARRDEGQPRKRLRPAAPVQAGRLFARYVQLLAPGDHTFAALRAEFGEWCEAGDLEPVSDMYLVAWLRDEGFYRRRIGKAKTTVYARPVRRRVA